MLYLPMLTLLEDRLRSSALVVADNADASPEYTLPWSGPRPTAICRSPSPTTSNCRCVGPAAPGNCGALNASALPTDKTYANKRKAAEILNKVWAEQPNHPGVVHYLIHSDDSPEFADAGLEAAICYSKIAPDAPHAR